MEQMKRQSGQAITEYILLLAIIVSLYSLLLRSLTDLGVFDVIKKPLENTYKYTYQYGHPEARGTDDGGPKNIPQQSDPQYFRIFINPPISD